MEITTEILNELIKCCKYHEAYPDWGERAYIARGENADVIYWDIGNSWCDILHVIPKVENPEQWLMEFFQKAMVLSEDDDEDE